MSYDILMVDPPWPKRKGGLRTARPNQGRNLGYSTLSVPDIFALLDAEIFPLAAEHHSVFLWCVDQFMHEAESEMEHRGYRRHARFVWDKTNGVAPAFTVRFSHEYLVWFYKPKFAPVATTQRGKYMTVMREKARQHSRKPDMAYAMIDNLYPAAKKIDVFSRESRLGWDQWGDQTSMFAAQPTQPKGE